MRSARPYSLSGKTDYYALFLRGADKIDFKKLKDVIGKASIASQEEVLKITGVDPGAVCPLLVGCACACG